MKWIRLWPDYILNGSTFDELTADQRGVWFSLLALAGYSPRPGTICIVNGLAYTDDQLSGFLKLPKDLLMSTVRHLASKEVDKIIINSDKTISIKNWSKYQTEYERQKPYRRGLQGKVTQKGYKQKLRVDTDTDTEVKIQKNKDIKTFVEHAFDSVLAKTGRKLLITGKDTKIIQRLLGTYPIEELKILWDQFQGSTDPFILKAGLSLGVFTTQINKLNTAVKAEPTGMDALRSIRIREGRQDA